MAVSNIIGSFIGPLKGVDWPMFEWGQSSKEILPNESPYSDISGMSSKISIETNNITKYYVV